MEMSIINEVLNQTHSIMDFLRQKIVCIFDQAFYMRAAEITWKQEHNIENRGFHIICNLLSSFRKRFPDASLRDLFVESGMITEGSLSAVMEMHNYSHDIRFHKIV